MNGTGVARLIINCEIQDIVKMCKVMISKPVAPDKQESLLRKVADIKNQAINLSINNCNAEICKVRNDIINYKKTFELKLTGVQDGFSLLETRVEDFVKLSRSVTTIPPEFIYEDIKWFIMMNKDCNNYFESSNVPHNNHITNETNETSMLMAEFHLVKKLCLRRIHDECLKLIDDMLHSIGKISHENRVESDVFQFVSDAHNSISYDLNNLYCTATFASYLNPSVDDAQRFIDSIKTGMTGDEFTELTASKSMEFQTPKYRRHTDKAIYR